MSSATLARALELRPIPSVLLKLSGDVTSLINSVQRLFRGEVVVNNFHHHHYHYVPTPTIPATTVIPSMTSPSFPPSSYLHGPTAYFLVLLVLTTIFVALFCRHKLSILEIRVLKAGLAVKEAEIVIKSVELADKNAELSAKNATIIDLECTITKLHEDVSVYKTDRAAAYERCAKSFQRDTTTFHKLLGKVWKQKHLAVKATERANGLNALAAERLEELQRTRLLSDELVVERNNALEDVEIWREEACDLRVKVGELETVIELGSIILAQAQASQNQGQEEQDLTFAHAEEVEEATFSSVYTEDQETVEEATQVTSQSLVVSRLPPAPQGDVFGSENVGEEDTGMKSIGWETAITTEDDIENQAGEPVQEVPEDVDRKAVDEGAVEVEEATGDASLDGSDTALEEDKREIESGSDMSLEEGKTFSSSSHHTCSSVLVDEASAAIPSLPSTFSFVPNFFFSSDSPNALSGNMVTRSPTKRRPIVPLRRHAHGLVPLQLPRWPENERNSAAGKGSIRSAKRIKIGRG